MMVIQEARPRDLPGILALREQTLARYRERGAPVLNPDHETILARTQQAIEQPFAWCGVALDGETVVGCLLLRLMECPLNRHKLVAVQEVFVTAPAARGLGLGVQLLAKAETWAFENGATEVLLAYRADEPHAPWFTRRGYVPLENYVVKSIAR